MGVQNFIPGGHNKPGATILELSLCDCREENAKMAELSLDHGKGEMVQSGLCRSGRGDQRS